MPLYRKDDLFPKGILQFNSKESLLNFYNQVQKNPESLNQIPSDFRSLKTSLLELKNKYELKNSNLSAPNNHLAPLSTHENDYAEEVSMEEYTYDLNSSTVNDEIFVELLNEDLQIIVGNNLEDFTRIGIFEVPLSNIDDYNQLMSNYQNSIDYNSSFTAIPGETSIGEGVFQVTPEITRISDFTYDMLRTQDEVIDNSGGGSGGSGNSGINGCGTSVTTINYLNKTVEENFKSENFIYFDDAIGNRRFTFSTYKQNFLGLGIYRRIGIQAKVQKRKKFVFVKYWGESYADEIVTGVDNMDLWTDYIFPTPTNFNQIQRPSFAGLAKFHIGNHVLDALNIDVNINALNFSLTNTQVSAFINSQFNTFVGNQYNNAFSLIERNLINAIDPSYLTRYAAYTKKVNSLAEQNKFRITMGKGEKPQGYSHKNTWQFDWNIGFGGAQYKYDMRAGSFYGRARIGCIWYALRTIRQ